MPIQNNEIISHITRIQEIAQNALPHLTTKTNHITHTQTKDILLIEQCLDHLLDFAFHPEILSLFKQLCRYYITINPIATKQYVYSYQDMYDEQ